MSSEMNSDNLNQDIQAEKQQQNSLRYLKYWSIIFGLLGLVFGVGKLGALVGLWLIPDSAGIGYIQTNGSFSWLMLVIMPALIGLGLWYRKRWVIVIFSVYFIIMVPGMLYHWLEGANIPNALLLFRAARDLKRSWQYFD
jgi:hypothetical protein